MLSSDIEDSQEIALCRATLQRLSHDHPDRIKSLNDLAAYLYIRFEQQGVRSDINEAITSYRESLQLLPHGHPHRSSPLHSLARCLSTRFRKWRMISDLNEEISLHSDALRLRSHGHPDRSESLTNLALCLCSRFGERSVVSDIDEAISLHREALELRPHGHSSRSESLSDISVCLVTRFGQLGSKSDLEEAINFEREAGELLPLRHHDRPRSLSNLGTCLRLRFQQLGSASDLEEAIILQREALALGSQGPNRFALLNHLANSLHTRFKQLGSMSDLEDALALQREGLELLPEDHADRAVSLTDLGDCLSTQFDQLGEIPNLEEAIFLHRAARRLRQKYHAHRPTPINNLARCLFTRFRHLGAMSDLDEAITLHRNALELREQGHPDRACSLNSIANCLHTRFKQLGVRPDLNEAITLHREALQLFPPSHSERSGSLNDIASCFYPRFRELGSKSDLDKANSLYRKAAKLRPHGHPARPQSLNGFANCLLSQFNQTGLMSDMKNAIAFQRQALELRSQGHPDRSWSLNDLADCLFARFENQAVKSDLDQATSLHREALALRPQGHPDRAISLKSLADCLRMRSKRFNMDHNEAFDLYANLLSVSQAVSTSDLKVTEGWVHAAEEIGHHTIVLAYQISLRLLAHHLAILPSFSSLAQHLQLLKKRTSSLAMDAVSACLRHGALHSAVELLEEGRGVFWGQLNRLRLPVDGVITIEDTGEDLAQTYMSLCRRLRNAFDSRPTSRENQTSARTSQRDRAFCLNIQLENVLSEMRKLSGVTGLPPSSFSDLREAASGGPVVILNASQYGCDGLIVFLDNDPIHIPLQISRARVRDLSSDISSLTQRAKTNDVTRELVTILRELWNLVVLPIVDILQESHPLRSRIWWCPTAEFTILPLHAAGSYRKGQPNLSDLYISSYTPTLSALIRSRRARPSDSASQQPRFVAVGQAQAPGEAALASIDTELATVAERVSPHATFTAIEGQDSTVFTVSEQVKQSEFVHLACHGIPDRALPFNSAFALGDGHLAIRSIMRFEMHHALFAYLSACHTTVGDEESPDEVIHLASAMQFAGFRSVVGTMWAVDDAHANKITSMFYANMVDEAGKLDHTRAAFALHKTMRSAKVPFDQQILFVHIGA